MIKATMTGRFIFRSPKESSSGKYLIQVLTQHESFGTTPFLIVSGWIPKDQVNDLVNGIEPKNQEIICGVIPTGNQNDPFKISPSIPFQLVAKK